MKAPYLNPNFEDELDIPESENVFCPSKDVLALMMQDIMNKEHGKVAPDTVGADYFFLEEFITSEMDSDFAVIEQDFLQHCSGKLHEFNDAGWYGEDERWNSAPGFAIKQRLVRLMYNGAKLGDSYCVVLIKYLYKLYHRKEYNQLKRFQRISPIEIFSLAEDEQGGVSYGGMGRILGMCRFMNIELDEKCSVLFLLLEKERKEWIQENEDNREYIGFEEKLFEECVRQVDTWMGPKKDADDWRFQKENQDFLDGESFVEVSLRHMNYPVDYMYMCSAWNMGPPLQMARTLAILKTMDSERKYTYEEVQRYTILYGAVSALVSASDSYEKQIDYLLGDKPDDSELEDAAFKPENIAVRKRTPQKTEESGRIMNVAPVSMGTAAEEDYLREIAVLRGKVNEQEQKINILRDQFRQVKIAQEENERALSEYRAEREELIALREYVYNLELEESPLTEETLVDMEKAIANKNIVIIGGHVNWINKLKERFPNWMFILPDSYKTVDGKMLEGKNRIYFFTDYLSHVTYVKFIATVRERHIPFGYLGSLNMEKIIRQIYEDMDIGEKAK